MGFSNTRRHCPLNTQKTQGFNLINNGIPSTPYTIPRFWIKTKASVKGYFFPIRNEIVLHDNARPHIILKTKRIYFEQ